MENKNSLKQNMVSGVKWTAVSQVARQLLQVTFIAILARLLSVDDFGVIAIAVIFLEFGMMLRDLGFGSAIIQKKDIQEEHLSTTFFVCILGGIVMFVILNMTAPFIASFFSRESLRFVIPVLALRFIFYSLSVVHEFMLMKKMLFRKLAIVEIGETITYGTVAITMALNGWGIWALVFGYVISGCVRFLLSWSVYRWKAKFSIHIKAFKEIFGFAGNMVGFKVVNYTNANLDRFLVGRFLPAASLGLYSMAYNLAVFPHQQTATMISRIGFAAFSKIQDELERIRLGYLKMVGYVSTVTFPLLFGLFVLARYFVLTVYSSKWLPMVMPLRMLCVAGLMLSITAFGGIVMLAVGRVDKLLKLSLIGLVIKAGLLLFGIRYGLNGVALMIVIYAVVINVLMQMMIKEVVKMKLRQYFLAFVPAFLSSLCMGGVLWGVATVYPNKLFLHTIPGIMSLVLVGAAVYLSVGFVINRQSLTGLLNILKGAFIK
ncbi:MAG: MOP flippase family protein [PVC group bacterium]|nr:MOP flippase family protein [PVC group bacterium]